jgi:hypothetical protein
MARVTTKTGVANLTASLLKVDAVTQIDPPVTGSKFARIANQWYDESRRDALADHIWNCAETQVNLAADSTYTAIGSYGARYILPADYIRVAWIGDEENPITDYKIKNGYIYINYDGSLPFGYIFDQEDITKWSSKLLQVVARKLAANAAYDMTGNRTFATEMEQKYIEYLSVATTVDGQESPPTHKIRRSKWKAAKEGYGIGGSPYQGRVVT